MNDNKIKKITYPMNDLGSVYTHYDENTGKNIPTDNKLPGGVDSGKASE